MTDINYPNPPLYCIAWDLDGEAKINIFFGLTNIDQCTTVNRENVETFDIESDYLARIEELGIVREEV